MAGEREPYEHLSYLFSRVFDLNLNVVGRPSVAEDTIQLGRPGNGPCVTLGLSDGRVCGVVLIDAPEELEHARTVVRARVDESVVKASMGGDSVSLESLARDLTT